MNIINSSNSTHLLKIIPRFYPAGEVTLELKNEERPEQVFYHQVVPDTADGYMNIAFELTTTNNTNFQIKISSGEEIVYRGKLFATDQTANLQQFKTTKDYFSL